MSTPSRQSLEVVLDDASLGGPVNVGTLYRDRHDADEVISFAYDGAYLASAGAIAIDPQLPLLPGPAYPAGNQRLFGIFRDTAPDRWGRTLMERREAMEARQAGRKLHHLSEWDFLVGVCDFTRMGALRLRTSSSPPTFVDDRELGAPPATRLRELEAIARQLTHNDADDDPAYAQWLAQLVAPGTSLGGARPKATFTDTDNTLWLAKFPAHDDRRDIGAWEYLAWQLASEAGIRMAPARLLSLGQGPHTFATQRFDRSPESRRLYASAMTLLGRDDGDPGSYLDLAEVIQTLGDPACIANDLAQLYRRAVFSILVGNRDDHLRNHGFLRTTQGWQLAPAFDINPNPDKREHVLAINADDPSPSIYNLHATHALYRLDSTQATRMENEARAKTRQWPTAANTLKLGHTAMQQLDAIIDAKRP